MKAVVLGICLTFGYVGSGQATVSVDDLYGSCNQRKTVQQAKALCYGYIAGIVDGVHAQAAMTGTPAFYCPGSNDNVEEFTKVFIKGVDIDPDLRSAPNAGVVVALLMRQNFPCNKTKL